jgi:SAM-dependent methyltransferase
MPRTDQSQTGPLLAVPCDLCGSSRDRTFLRLPDMIANTSDHVYRVARCRSCDLIYLNPRPPVWQLGNYYPESYAPFTRKGIASHARTWLHQRSVRELERLLGPPRRVLDVGCGTGELLEQVRMAGNPDVVGIEPSSQAALIARSTRGLDVRTGTLEQFRLPSDSVDTVLMSHVIEHLPSPRLTMQEIHRVLKPGGAAIIWVPNAASLAAKMLARYWMGWDVPRHLYAFTPATLHRLISSASLLPGPIYHERHGLEWAWGLRLWVESRGQSRRLARVLRLVHPFAGAALSPLGFASAALGRSGRIRIICRKPMDQIN